MMKKILGLFFCLQITGIIFAQTSTIKGTVSDSKTKETIVGATIIIDVTTGTATDINGEFTHKIAPGKHKIEFKYIGYKPQTKNIDIKDGEVLTFNIILDPESTSLDIVVISAGRFEQKLTDVTVSMAVIKPELITNKASVTAAEVVDQVPGVTVLEGQVNIRGGGGFSYGAGSRVLVLVDEMPMLTADAAGVTWNALPIENCEQVEVISGAASALFGSAAMSGVINFRTGYAKDKPETKINYITGVYGDPKRKELVNWHNGKPYYYSNVNFYHAQKIKNLDLVVGGNLYDDKGFKYLSTERRGRTNINLRYNFEKIKGLQVGVNSNFVRSEGGLFILWQNPDSAYYPKNGTVGHFINYRTNVDPYITYFTKNHSKHTLRTRFYRSNNTNNTNQSSRADIYYSEYVFQKTWDNGFSWTTGAVFNYSEVHAGTLFGTHYSTNVSQYNQLDKKWNRLSLSTGIRFEYFQTDYIATNENTYLFRTDSYILGNRDFSNTGNGKGIKLISASNSQPTGIHFGKNRHGNYGTISGYNVKPVFRFGANYRVFKATWLRSSFGQGYRFPSIAERYVKTNVDVVSVYPNDTLKPESGWSAEVAVKQGFKIGEWQGYLDAIAFWTEYRQMMEFVFGQWGTKQDLLQGVGFKSINIGNTCIRGFETSLMGLGKVGPFNVTTLIGYTFLDPRQVDWSREKNLYIGNIYTGGTNTDSTNLLKYRFKHSGKANIDISYKKFNIGASCRLNSYMNNIDRFVGDNEQQFPGNKAYREAHSKGDYILDLRAGWQINKTAKLAFVVNNVMNREVMGRPVDLLPPRVYITQFTFTF